MTIFLSRLSKDAQTLFASVVVYCLKRRAFSLSLPMRKYYLPVLSYNYVQAVKHAGYTTRRSCTFIIHSRTIKKSLRTEDETVLDLIHTLGYSLSDNIFLFNKDRGSVFLMYGTNSQDEKYNVQKHRETKAKKVYI